MALAYYISPRRKQAILEAHGGKCHYCGKPACQIDHIHPKKLGGTDDLDNLLPACPPCNGRKGARPLPFFQRWRAKRKARGMRPKIEKIQAGGQPQPAAKTGFQWSDLLVIPLTIVYAVAVLSLLL